MSKKPVMLCIMDGFGWTPDKTFGNAVAAANKPNLDKLFANYPMTTIEASGMAVGLPDGQMGNSEVGHTNMGAGRIVYQQLTLITKSIKDGEMFKNPVLVKNMKAAIDAGKAIHLMGLVGTGKTATADQAEEVCAAIRKVVGELYGEDAAKALTVQYGGSMNPKNAEELLSKPDVDGGLIGGASLKADQFAVIVDAATKG